MFFFDFWGFSPWSWGFGFTPSHGRGHDHWPGHGDDTDPDTPVDPTPVNTAPVLEAETSVSINPLGNASFDVVDALDADGDELVFSLSGDDADQFEIDPETGEITLVSGAKFYETVAELKAGIDEDAPPNAFGQAVAAEARGYSASDIVSHAGQCYDISVTVTDSEGATDSADLTVDVLGLF